MILFTILLLTLVLLVLFVILAVSLIGGVGIIVFGDVIVCVVFIALILTWIIKKKKK